MSVSQNLQNSMACQTENWDEDFASPSCLKDFIWPEGAELRGNVTPVSEEVIDRQEVDVEWNRIKSKLRKKLR